MPQTYPHALVVCIRDGRPPQSHEVAAVFDKIWRDTGAPGLLSANDVTIAVWLALAGSKSFAASSPARLAA